MKSSTLLLTILVLSLFSCELDNLHSTLTGVDFNTSIFCYTVYFSADYDGAIEYRWDFGDGNASSEQNPEHNYKENGNYTVKLLVSTAEGAGTVSKSITIDTEAITVTDLTFETAKDCYEVTFSSNYPNAKSYEWDFGDDSPISNEANPSHTYESYGTYRVRLYITTGGGAGFFEDMITIDPELINPELDLTINATFECYTVTFSSNYPDAKSYEWDFGDNSPISNEANPVHTYPPIGNNYEVRLYITSNDGAAVTTKLLPVHPEALILDADSASFEYTVDCLTYSFMPILSGAKSYHWDFGDGTTSEEEQPEHFFDSPGNYTVKLRVQTNYGAAEKEEAITVEVDAGHTFDEFHAQLEGDKIFPGINSSLVNVTGQSSDGVTKVFQFENGNLINTLQGSMDYEYVTYQELASGNYISIKNIEEQGNFKDGVRYELLNAGMSLETEIKLESQDTFFIAKDVSISVDQTTAFVAGFYTCNNCGGGDLPYAEFIWIAPTNQLIVFDEFDSNTFNMRIAQTPDGGAILISQHWGGMKIRKINSTGNVEWDGWLWDYGHSSSLNTGLAIHILDNNNYLVGVASGGGNQADVLHMNMTSPINMFTIEGAYGVANIQPKLNGNFITAGVIGPNGSSTTFLVEFDSDLNDLPIMTYPEIGNNFHLKDFMLMENEHILLMGNDASNIRIIELDCVGNY